MPRTTARSASGSNSRHWRTRKLLPLMHLVAHQYSRDWLHPDQIALYQQLRGMAARLNHTMSRQLWQSFSSIEIGEWRGTSQPRALSEPDVNLSVHPAPIIQPLVPGSSGRTSSGCAA